VPEEFRVRVRLAHAAKETTRCTRKAAQQCMYAAANVWTMLERSGACSGFTDQACHTAVVVVDEEGTAEGTAAGTVAAETQAARSCHTAAAVAGPRAAAEALAQNNPGEAAYVRISWQINQLAVMYDHNKASCALARTLEPELSIQVHASRWTGGQQRAREAEEQGENPEDAL